jgi:proteasome lid subunit RPN8/RPN11
MASESPVKGLAKVAQHQIYDHCFESQAREVGGVLVGHITARGPIVVGAIRAEHAAESLTTLTFTQDAWAHIHHVRDRDYADFEIVGWYHSHPGHGIFLSEQDLFIHTNFFSGEYQIAYVIDPVAGQEGVFGWRNGEVVRWYRGPTSRRVSEPARVDAPRPLPRPRTGRDHTSPVAGRHQMRLPEPEQTSRRFPTSSNDPWLPFDASLFLAIIGLALGVCVWALLLR